MKTLDKRVCLQSRDTELLKILDNTVAIYRQRRWRSATEAIASSNTHLLSSNSRLLSPETRLLSPSMGEGGGGAGENVENAVELEREVTEMEDALFRVQDESDRQLFLESLQEDTDMFFVFTEWAERQRRKRLDTATRNFTKWEETRQLRLKAFVQLHELCTVFDRLKTPPPNLVPLMSNDKRQQEILKNKLRQMNLYEASNPVSFLADFRESMLSLQLRDDFITQSLQSIDDCKRSIVGGADKQKQFLHVLSELRKSWNCVKVPYQAQLFNTNENDYPHRCELWVEMLSIPSNVWGLEILSDPAANMAPYLWTAADQANYKPRHLQENPRLAEDWKTNRVKRKFGLPSLMTPPLPANPVFDVTYWCQIFGVSSQDKEDIFPDMQVHTIETTNRRKRKQKSGGVSGSEAIKGEDNALGGEDGALRKEDEAVSTKTEEDKLNLVIRLHGDVGTAVKEKKLLHCRCSFTNFKPLTEQGEQLLSRSTSLGPTTSQGATTSLRVANSVSTAPLQRTTTVETKKTASLAEEKSASSDSYTRVDNFAGLQQSLLVIQRTCFDRAVFAILQAQGVRSLGDMTYPLVDDESCTYVAKCIKSRCVKTEILHDRLIHITPIMWGSKQPLEHQGTWRPAFYEIPKSWCVWPIVHVLKSKRRISYLAAQRRCNVLAVDAYKIGMELVQVPIIMPPSTSSSELIPTLSVGGVNVKGAVTVAAFADVIVSISFDKRQKSGRRRQRVTTQLSVYTQSPTANKQSDPLTATPHDLVEQQSTDMQSQRTDRDRLGSGWNSLGRPVPSDSLQGQIASKMWRIERQAVCFLRHYVLEKSDAATTAATLVDFHRTSLPATRTPQGGVYLNEFQDWLFSRVAMCLFD